MIYQIILVVTNILRTTWSSTFASFSKYTGIPKSSLHHHGPALSSKPKSRIMFTTIERYSLHDVKQKNHNILHGKEHGTLVHK